MATEINDPCLAEFICCIMALIIFLKLKLRKNRSVEVFFFLKPNCQLISHASNHLTQTKSSIYFSDRERAFIS